MKKFEIAARLESICMEIKRLLNGQNDASFDNNLDLCMKQVGYLANNDNLEFAKEAISNLSGLSDGRGSLSDIGFYDKEVNEQLYGLVRELNAKINEFEHEYGLSRIIGEYNVDKNGKIKYKWFK